MKHISFLILAVVVVGYLLSGCGGDAATGPPSGKNMPAADGEAAREQAALMPGFPSGDARPHDGVEAEPLSERTPESTEHMEEAPLLEVSLYPDDAIFRIDYPIGIRLILCNNSPRSVEIKSRVNYLKGFEIDDTPLGRAKFDEAAEELEPPLVIPSGGSVGIWLDLGRHFPGLRKPGHYRIRWSDPYLGASGPLDIVVTDYALLITDYGDVALKLLPQAAPKTVEQFRRLAGQGFYDGSAVGGIKAHRMVVVSPPGEKMRVFADRLAPLAQETSTQSITSGDVVIARRHDVEMLRRGLPEREEFLKAVVPSFFVQLAPLPSRGEADYTVFGRVFRGLEVLSAISRARQATGSQGQEISTPARKVKIKRVVLIEEGRLETVAKTPKDATPDVTMNLLPHLQQFTYGEPLNLQLRLSNPYNEPLRVPQDLGVKKGLKIFKIEGLGSGGETSTIRRPQEISESLPDVLLPLAGGLLRPGGIAGVRLDITDLCPAFARGGRFEIFWEGGGLKTTPLTIDIQRSLFASIQTTRGSLEVVLFEETAPRAVERFTKLAREGLYDNLAFHRVVNTPALSLVQTGSSSGTETGRAEGEPVPLEASDRKFRVGTVGFAHTPADPDSGSSQFFIVTEIRPAGAAALFRRYAQIGRVMYACDEHGKPTDIGALLGKITIDDRVTKIEISEKKPQWDIKEES